jgi:hypothetical protein
MKWYQAQSFIPIVKIIFFNANIRSVWTRNIFTMGMVSPKSIMHQWGGRPRLELKARCVPSTALSEPLVSLKLELWDVVLPKATFTWKKKKTVVKDSSKSVQPVENYSPYKAGIYFWNLAQRNTLLDRNF